MGKGFQMVPLGELLTPVNRPEPTILEKQYSILGAHWYAHGLYIKDVKLGSEIQADKVYRVEEGDFVYNRLFAWKGSFALALKADHGCYVSNEFPCFRVKENKIDGQYLWKYFSRSSAWNEALGLSSGGTPTSRNRLKEAKLLEMEIPLPPLEEQQRIVVQIEELAAKIEEARGLRRKAMEEAEKIISHIISNLSFDERSWTTMSTTILGRKGSVRSGPFGSQLHHDEFVESGVAAIGTRDVQVNQFKLSSGWYITREKYEQFNRYQVFPGDILGTIVGASIGRFCVVPKNAPLAFTTKHVIALTLDPSKAETEFISYLLNFHKRSRISLFAQSEGSAQPSLNSTKILRAAIPLPPIPEQRRIIDYIDGFYPRVKMLQQLQSVTSDELGALLPSILDKAFKGEL